MANPRLTAYTARLATRGLSIVGFDGHTLQLRYDPHTDVELPGGVGEVGDLSGFAIEALNEFPGPELFPGIRSVDPGR